jgi:hypothetical protein
MKQGRIMKTPFIYCRWDWLCRLPTACSNGAAAKQWIFPTDLLYLQAFLLKKANIMQIITKQKSLDIRGNLLGFL